MMQERQLIIIGAGGHGRVVADIARLSGYSRIAFLDDGIKKGESVAGRYPVLGQVSDSAAFSDDAVFVVAIGNNAVREKVVKQLEAANAELATLIHPNATIADDVKIGKATVVMAGAVINVGARIGDGVIVNTASSIDHDCAVGDYVHVSVGAHLAGTVTLGKRVMIGAGATVINNIGICDDVTVGGGACVVKDIDTAGVYVGVPAVCKKQI